MLWWIMYESNEHIYTIENYGFINLWSKFGIMKIKYSNIYKWSHNNQPMLSPKFPWRLPGPFRARGSAWQRMAARSAAQTQSSAASSVASSASTGPGGSLILWNRWSWRPEKREVENARFWWILSVEIPQFATSMWIYPMIPCSLEAPCWVTTYLAMWLVYTCGLDYR